MTSYTENIICSEYQLYNIDASECVIIITKVILLHPYVTAVIIGMIVIVFTIICIKTKKYI